MLRRTSIVILWILFFPFTTHAFAGFASSPVWISSVSPTERDSLKLFAVVNNTSTTTVSGTVSFLIDQTIIGSVQTSLVPGDAQILSVEWKAVADTHTLSATFTEDGDSPDQPPITSITTPLTITVAEIPQKSPALKYFNTVLDTAEVIKDSTISEALQTIEDIRKKGADYFANQIALSTDSPTIQNTNSQGKVLGAETENTAVMAATASASEKPGGFSFTLNRLGQFIFEHPILFYPALLLFLFFMLWLILNIFSRG